jgi:predicted nuclease with TOPRIM domain
MSASTIEVRGSTESLQLAHLFKVHGLQEELEHLKLKINDRSVPLDEIIQDASRIHQEHRQLAGDVEALSTNLDTLRNKNDGKVPDRIARSKRAIENEVSL